MSERLTDEQLRLLIRISPDEYEVEAATEILALRARVAQLEAGLQWAVSRWEAEVKNRPMQNIHRRSLDDTWRQVIRYFGGDAVELCGPAHDDLAAFKDAPQ